MTTGEKIDFGCQLASTAVMPGIIVGMAMNWMWLLVGLVVYSFVILMIAVGRAVYQIFTHER